VKRLLEKAQSESVTTLIGSFFILNLTQKQPIYAIFLFAINFSIIAQNDPK
jgi:hypothetical protein